MGKRKVADGKMAPHFENAEAARLFLEGIRWPNGPICPKCGTSSKPYALKGGKYRCSDKDCKADFTVRVGTVFESSHIPLHKWLLAAYLLCSSKKGISSHQIHRMMGVTYKTAWFMTHRIREAMKSGPLVKPMGGPGGIVEVDETFIGRDKSKKPIGSKKGRGYAHKFKVLSLIDRDSKRASSVVIDDLRMRTIMPILDRKIHPDSVVMTDEAGQYSRVGWHFARHDFVRHKDEEYVRGNVHTNTAEGFFSIFKLGLINNEQNRCASCKYTIEQAKQGHLEIVTSAFTLAEVFKRRCAASAEGLPPESDTNFEDYLLEDFIILVGVDREVGTYARRLLRTHSEIKKPQDAIHLATAALNNVDEFHTFDGKNLLPLNEKVARADAVMLRVCTPIAPPPDTSGPLFEKSLLFSQEIMDDDDGDVASAAGEAP